jgi:hypothetical protein
MKQPPLGVAWITMRASKALRSLGVARSESEYRYRSQARHRNPSKSERWSRPSAGYWSSHWLVIACPTASEMEFIHEP